MYLFEGDVEAYGASEQKSSQRKAAGRCILVRKQATASAAADGNGICHHPSPEHGMNFSNIYSNR